MLPRMFSTNHIIYMTQELRLVTGMIRAAHTPVFRLLGGGAILRFSPHKGDTLR